MYVCLSRGTGANRVRNNRNWFGNNILYFRIL